jgi:hypothetical protein
MNYFRKSWQILDKFYFFFFLTGNARIQVTHIVWDSIPKFRNNRSLLMSTYDFIYTCYKIKFHWSLL